MNCRFTFLLLALALPATGAQAENLYKWVDENGVTHYGDSIPARDAKRQREVLNEHGVSVDVLPREKTREELAAEAARLREIEAAEQLERAARERDERLLATYLSVDEIADLRDRRILALEAQIGVTRHYLKNLESKWEDLEAETKRYNFPYVEDSDLPPLPDDIAQHVIHTEKAMAEHMQTVRALRQEQDAIRAEFRQDMERFQELTADTSSDGTEKLTQF